MAPAWADCPGQAAEQWRPRQCEETGGSLASVVRGFTVAYRFMAVLRRLGARSDVRKTEVDEA